VVRDAGDPAQSVVGTLTRRVHLTDDRMLGASDLRRVRQARHGRPDTVSAMVAAYRLQRAGWIRKPQFGCVREQFDHVIETTVIDGRCVEMHQVGKREPVGSGQAHGSGGRPLLSRISIRHSRRVCPVCCMHSRTGFSSA
jgi:hypothetical protein